MELPIKFDTVKSGWSIVYIEGSQVIISKNIEFLSLKIDFVLANSADPDEMPHYAAFHLGLHCLPKYMFLGFLVHKGLIVHLHISLSSQMVYATCNDQAVSLGFIHVLIFLKIDEK